ncbi:MAG: response regulator transcription factor [Rhodocyclaceae bacterium]|nr:response regulator transcription factor [Rhodocyclaceae bacterium]
MQMHQFMTPPTEAEERDQLLELMRQGLSPGPHYRRSALRWLSRRIEFDGCVWGVGRRLEDGTVSIDDASVEGRSRSLLDEFVDVAGLDPVSRRFAQEPRRLQNVSVERDYAASALRPVGEYLRRHRIGQLLLCGVTHPRHGGLSWLTLYREDPARPFNSRDADFAEFALPFVLLAQAAPWSGVTPLAERLSRRELEVAMAYASGSDYKTIAQHMSLAPATVRSHLQRIYRKLAVRSKIALRQRLFGET